MDEESQEIKAMIGFAALDAGYMLESAINATAAAASDSDGLTQMILQEHLKDLCGIQLSHIHDLVKGEHVRDENDGL